MITESPLTGETEAEGRAVDKEDQELSQGLVEMKFVVIYRHVNFVARTSRTGNTCDGSVFSRCTVRYKTSFGT